MYPVALRIGPKLELLHIQCIRVIWLDPLTSALKQRVLSTLRPPIANGKQRQVPDRDIVALYHLGVKCLQGLKYDLHVASNGVMECPRDPRSSLEHLHIRE